MLYPHFFIPALKTKQVIRINSLFYEKIIVLFDYPFLVITM